MIVTADDFGAAREVNEAVEKAHREGILTAASLMVAAPGSADAVARAKSMPSLGVGLHIVLVEGRPLSPPDNIPDLVDNRGYFRSDMVRAGAAMFFRPTVRAQLLTEIEAQFAAFGKTGLPLDHVNAHKHFHLHPTIASTILAIGKRYGMRAMRVPLERQDVLSMAEPGTRHSATPLTDMMSRLLRRRLRAADVCVPDAVFGLAWSGAMNASRLRGLIAYLPDGLSEIYLHPATGGGFEGAAPGYGYERELAALTDTEVIAATRAADIQLGTFATFCAPSPAGFHGASASAMV